MKLIYPEYALPVLLALLLSALFPSTRHFTNPLDKKKYRYLQLITLLGAIVGAKLSALSGDFYWPWKPLNGWSQIIYSGRSLTGGLIFGHLAAEIAKPFVGYRLPPNNRFAVVLPFSVATGRLGCLFAGCCRGLPYQSWFSITYSDGIPRHPEPLYEIIFQISVGILFIFLLKRKFWEGLLFSFYLILYGVFRFFSEFVRETPKFIQGYYSMYQVFSLIILVMGIVEFVRYYSFVRKMDYPR